MSFLVLVCLCAVQTKAIIYRHDVGLDKYQALATHPGFACIGRVYSVDTDSPRLSGSCVLIAGKYVLTALHVMKLHDIDAGKYKVGYNGKMYDVSAYRSYPQKGHDILLLKLSVHVEDVVAALMDTLSPIVYDTVTMVGYGGLRPSDKTDGDVGINVKTAAHNIIDSLAGEELAGRLSRLYITFDGPLRGRDNMLPLEGMPNGGDSGGGLFVKRNGKYHLVGITSGNRVNISFDAGYYGSRSNWSNVTAYRSWIQQSIRELEK